MRKLFRNMARIKMTRLGVSKVNKRMNHGRWREIIGAYPVNLNTGERMTKGFRGSKRYKKGARNPLFVY